jgi:hypothetical protein
MKTALLAALLLITAVVALATPPPRPNPLTLATPVLEHFTAVVDERLKAGSYTYVRLHDAAGAERWIATLGATAPDTTQVTVDVFARLQRFESPRLGRTFAPLSFARLSPNPGVSP